MHRFRLRSASKLFLSSSSSSSSSATPKRCFHCSLSAIPHGCEESEIVVARSRVRKEKRERKSIISGGLLNAVEDQHGGVIVNMNKRLDSKVFSSMLHASISHWRQQGKKGVWIKLPIESSNLVEAATKAGFRYHHAEPEYLMLVRWIPNTPDILPANASHRVSIGAFVVNSKREVLVVQERCGRFSGIGLWKLPTGAVSEGEDICTAATREVKEETGIDTDFVEVLAFRQGHKSFFQKSDLFFICMLQPRSFDIQKQASEIDAAQWMPIEEYAAQPLVGGNELFGLITKVCLAKLGGTYNGFSSQLTTSCSGKQSFLYFNGRIY
ncbi:nudix hydrolase 2-like [Neltuma alba]|uniref:nudix hydrolase 2-like n=1 Tax=Neltuma alba TaxID=207710 RepID=UPI0010A410E6|nr:nudix hydrolase 2-like [Prosopis alba]